MPNDDAPASITLHVFHLRITNEDHTIAFDGIVRGFENEDGHLVMDTTPELAKLNDGIKRKHEWERLPDA